MGTVYRARHKSTNAVRAVKILSNQAGLNDEVVARFKREVLLSSRLSHPNIVRVYEAGLVPDGDQAGRPYYTMDYVQGRDLLGWTREGARTPSEATAMVVTICEAMNYAHGHGVIHRDLKPGNVLVDKSEDRPLICDFGLAKYKADMQNLTQTGDILGTPSYMPPEQALGDRKKIGPPTDTYAIGAILYYLLTSRPPFTAPSAFATINKVVREPPKPPSEHNPAVSAALEQVVLKALSKEPIDRFHTCSDLGDALRASGS
jgi:eukaryotic-like serine/threonine-protein kinase